MIGRVVSQYTITEKLGSGGMGVVYKAFDSQLHRQVALKFMPAELNADTEAKERFVQEARAAAALDHASICTIYEIGETGDAPEYGASQTFIAMAFYEGHTLDHRIKQGPIPRNEALTITVRIAQGLARAHAEGIVHRDIKPANVMLTDDGEVKILDFGIAKLTGQTLRTSANANLGTPTYMSPEQARGEDVDGRSDLWSLGVILYQMLSGRLPFQGEYYQAVIYAILSREPAALTGEDVNIVAVVDRLLAKDRQERYPAAEDLVADLTGIITDTQLVIPRRKRRPTWRYYAYMAVPLLILLVVLQLRHLGTDPPPPTAIAVAPFENLTGDTEYDLWSRGIANLVCDELGASDALHVISVYTVNNVLNGLSPDTDQVAATAELLAQAADQLQVKTLVTGSIMASGGNIRVVARLHDTASGQDRATQMATCTSEDDFFALAQDLGERLRDSLEIELLGETTGPEFKPAGFSNTSSATAYRHFIQSLDWAQDGNWPEAIEEVENALAIDPDFHYARFFLMLLHHSHHRDDQRAREQLDLLLAVKDELPLARRYAVEAWRASWDKDPRASLAYLRKLIDIEPLNASHYWFAGFRLWLLGRRADAADMWETCLELSRQQNGFYYRFVGLYQVLGEAYRELGNFERATEMHVMGLDLISGGGHSLLYRGQAINCLRAGDPVEARVWLDRKRASLEERGVSHQTIDFGEALDYRDGGDLEHAREILVRLSDENPDWTSPRVELAATLIEQDVEIDGAMRLIDEAIEIAARFDIPDYAQRKRVLLLRGRAQLKLGNPEQALELLGAAWEKETWYQPEMMAWIQEAQVAIRDQ